MPNVEHTLHQNVLVALDDMLDDAIASVRYMMLYGYSGVHYHKFRGVRGTDIYDTGLLYEDVQGYVDNAEQAFYVGSTLYYASYVHDGTNRLTGSIEPRPYLLDGVTLINNFDSIAKRELPKGIDHE